MICEIREDGREVVLRQPNPVGRVGNADAAI